MTVIKFDNEREPEKSYSKFSAIQKFICQIIPEGNVPQLTTAGSDRVIKLKRINYHEYNLQSSSRGSVIVLKTSSFDFCYVFFLSDIPMAKLSC